MGLDAEAVGRRLFMLPSYETQLTRLAACRSDLLDNGIDLARADLRALCHRQTAPGLPPVDARLGRRPARDRGTRWEFLRESRRAVRVKVTLKSRAIEVTMNVTLGAQSSAPHTLAPQIRTRILVSRIDPPRVVELVEYTDGRFGIQENGEPVAQPWVLGRIEACVRSYCSLAENGSRSSRGRRRGRRRPLAPASKPLDLVR